MKKEDNEQLETHKPLGKQYKNDSGLDKNFDKVQARNGFESGQDHETRMQNMAIKLPYLRIWDLEGYHLFQMKHVKIVESKGGRY